MKKYNFIAAMLFVILLLTPLNVNAEDVTWTPPYEYGLMEDGLFVHTIIEEMEGCPDEIYYEEICKAKRARAGIEMTEKMKEAGYVYDHFIDKDTGERVDFVREGYDQTADGITKISYYKKKMEENAEDIPDEYGYLYISATVAKEIKDSNSDIFVYIEGTDVLGYYGYKLHAVNDYVTSVKVPVGHYKIESAGLVNDYTDKYPAEFSDEEFYIGEGGATVIRYRVGTSVSIFDIIQDDKDIIEDYYKNKEETQSESSFDRIFVWAGLVIVFVMVIVIIRKYKKENQLF